ncbi:CLUMA_CG017457, isoform A [Clunio marinus]|uniref:CLUMA_CG017457, isoform A n=1 Tax=Clunio marinus TaxID=568069 RepID=A0A1J1IXR9_9DIPT|nr:CLUMA_CG017457, isoform A [Clunio marinus]
MSQPQQQLQVVLDFLKTSYKFDVFHEPRGVMRILQLIFAIWGFFACRDFSVTLDMDCNDAIFKKRYEIEYPFEFGEHICKKKSENMTLFLSVDSSTGAQFFVITAVLSVLYALFIIFVYAYLDEMYKSKPEFPMADFALTAILAFFWLVGTFGFSSGGSALKKTFDENFIGVQCASCVPKTSSFTDLSIALMIGFLNFFLWTSDLWFLYKETIWFQQRNQILNQPMYAQQQQFGQQQFDGQPQYEQQQTQQYEPQQQQQQQYGYSEQSYGQQQPYGQQSYGQQPNF